MSFRVSITSLRNGKKSGTLIEDLGEGLKALKGIRTPKQDSVNGLWHFLTCTLGYSHGLHGLGYSVHEAAIRTELFYKSS